MLQGGVGYKGRNNQNSKTCFYQNKVSRNSTMTNKQQTLPAPNNKINNTNYKSPSSLTPALLSYYQTLNW